MKLQVVELRLEKKYTIDVETENERVYGVETSGEIFIKSIGNCNVEHVSMICLDSTNKIVNYANVSIGNIDSVKVSIAEIIKIALLSNASKIIIAHNHPSGVLEITNNDIEMTRKIGFLAQNLGIELIDSIVVNGENAVSIREKIKETN